MKITKKKYKSWCAYQRWIRDNYLTAFVLDQNGKVVAFQFTNPNLTDILDVDD